MERDPKESQDSHHTSKEVRLQVKEKWKDIQVKKVKTTEPYNI